MKNFNQFILTLLAAGLFASCSLTEEPTSFVNRKSFYKNESQCIAALNSCYMPANAIYTANFMLVTEACTDIWYSSSTTVDACLDVTPAKPQYGKNVWTQGYKGVMYCNECVECISSADLADGVKMPLAAEARVMRAFYYYVLTCMFGDVPFYTTMVDTDQRLAEIRRLPRTPAHEIRQELYDDLERNALPWFTAENGRKCRASEAVDNRSGYALALMLMAKFAMWNEDWNGALVPLQALEELYGDFNEGNYPLAETQWRYKNPAESIFEIQHAWSLTGTQYNGNVAAIMMPTHNGDGVFDGVPLKGYGTSMPGWSSLRANNRYAIFRPATGNTQTENAAYVDALFNPLPLTYDTYDATLNRYTVKIDREALAAGEIRGQKIDRRVQYFLGLGDLEAGETFKITHNYGVPWPGPKFWCPDIEQNYDSNNYRIFRYADAILMMAECYCNLENAEETMRYLNMVRQRAGVDPVTNFTGFEDLTLAVRCERARELGGEFQRKFDLVRWGIDLRLYQQRDAQGQDAPLPPLLSHSRRAVRPFGLRADQRRIPCRRIIKTRTDETNQQPDTGARGTLRGRVRRHLRGALRPGRQYGPVFGHGRGRQTPRHGLLLGGVDRSTHRRVGVGDARPHGRQRHHDHPPQLRRQPRTDPFGRGRAARLGA